MDVSVINMVVGVGVDPRPLFDYLRLLTETSLILQYLNLLRSCWAFNL